VLEVNSPPSKHEDNIEVNNYSFSNTALMKKHNFSAGPSILDESVIKDAASAVLNYAGTGLSILEVSHRGKEFTATMEEARKLMKELLDVPEGYELLNTSGDMPHPLLISKQVELTGEDIDDAQPDRNEKGQPGVSVSFNNSGAAIFADLTRNNVGKRMAMVLIDQGKAEVVTAPQINEPIPNGKTIISGSMSFAEAEDISLLLRAGSLAAPMQIVEERTIGPSLGKENIEKGFNSTLWGFAAVAAFMVVYYRLMGFFSTIALSTNILFLVGILSAMQATLTLPGIAALALTLGMAIDSNVLINERIREELRGGIPPQQAINLGFQHAWATIVDSNLTSLIAGIAFSAFIAAFAATPTVPASTTEFKNLLEFLSFLMPYIFAKEFISPISKGDNNTASESGIGIAAIATALKVKVAMAVCANDLFLFSLNASISFFAACIPSGIKS